MDRRLRPRNNVDYAALNEGRDTEEVRELEDGLRVMSPSPAPSPLPQIDGTELENLRHSVEQARHDNEVHRLKRELEALTLDNAALTSPRLHDTGRPRVRTHLPSSSRERDINRVTTKDLQALPVLREQVDAQLASYGLSDTDSPSEDEDAPRPHSERQRRGKKLRSGKTAKLTSSVVRQQLWPHSQLSLSYVTKNIVYDELSLAEFAAGYSTILSLSFIGTSERSARIVHFTSLMYLATSYPWPLVRSLHAAVLFEIECGRLNWGDSFYHLESRILNRSGGSSAGVAPVNKSSQVFFCGPFQRGRCTHSGAHFGVVSGNQKKWVQHICARCWLRSKAKEAHPESSSSCPLKSSTESPAVAVPVSGSS